MGSPMGSLEFDHKGETYRVGRLPAKVQFHVTRRLAPLLSAFGGSLNALAAAFGDGGEKKAQSVGADKDLGEGLAALGPIMEALAGMDDEPLDYVINACLAVTERRQAAGGWAMVKGPGGIMFEDIDMAGLLTITGHALQHNLAGFFGDLPRNSPARGRT